MEFEIPDDPPVVEFSFERLLAYRAGVAFRTIVLPLCRLRTRGTVELRDQLTRASLSIVTNLAEGAGKFAPAEKARFYSKALGSVTECVALLGQCREDEMINDHELRRARYAAHAVVSMLTKLINNSRSQ